MHHVVVLGMILTRCAIDMDPPCAISCDGKQKGCLIPKEKMMRVEIRPGEGGTDAERFAQEWL